MASARLANRTEEIVIHALGHLLNGSEASREALQNFMLTLGADIGRISRVSTEYTGRRPGGTPDLVGENSAGEERLLVEAKFDAPLTQNQPVEYLHRLQPGRPSVLLFLSPSWRLNSLWEELRQRVKADNCLEGLKNEHKEPEILWGDVGENRKLILTSWRFLLDNIAAQASSTAAQTINDVHQIQGLVERRSFESLRRGELPAEFPRSLPHLYALVDESVQCLVDKGLASTAGYRPAAQGGYSVRYFTFCNLPSSSFGIYFGNWRTYHHSPLQFTLHESELNKLRSEAVASLRDGPFHARQNEGGDHLYIPIHLNGGDYQTVLASIVEQVERIANLVQAPEAESWESKAR